MKGVMKNPRLLSIVKLGLRVIPFHYSFHLVQTKPGKVADTIGFVTSITSLTRINVMLKWLLTIFRKKDPERRELVENLND